MLIFLIVDKVRGVEIDIVETFLVRLPLVLILIINPLWTLLSILPKFRYLENNKLERPTFKHSISSEIVVPKDFNFNNLKAEIAENWIISFSDDTNYVLKFREKKGFWKSYGAGAWLHYDVATKTVYLECFSIFFQTLEEPQNLQKNIENCLELNDLFELTLARYGEA